MARVDLHTHSIVSYDGGIALHHYASLLFQRRAIDYVAVTDHNRIDAALELRRELGDRIIVGEEIAAIEADVIGLFLTNQIEPGMTLAETIKAIKAQGGLVYAPHPYERGRRSLGDRELESLHGEFDIIEIFNGRGWGRHKHQAAFQFAAKYRKARASSSDAHGKMGVGTAYVELAASPTRGNLVDLLERGTRVCRYAPAISYFDPTINRIKKYFSIKHAS